MPVRYELNSEPFFIFSHSTTSRQLARSHRAFTDGESGSWWCGQLLCIAANPVWVIYGYGVSAHRQALGDKVPPLSPISPASPCCSSLPVYSSVAFSSLSLKVSHRNWPNLRQMPGLFEEVENTAGCAPVHTHARVRTHAHTHTSHTRTHAHSHTHTHTHTHTFVFKSITLRTVMLKFSQSANISAFLSVISLWPPSPLTPPPPLPVSLCTCLSVRNARNLYQLLYYPHLPASQTPIKFCLPPLPPFLSVVVVDITTICQQVKPLM